MSRAWRVALVFGVLLLGSGAAAVVWIGIRSLDEPLRVAAPVRFKVIPGASFSRVAAELAAQKVIANPRAWVLYARWSHLASAVKAGEYEIQPGTTPRELLTKMVNGQVLLHSFTIVDGWRVQDMLAALRRNPDIVSTLDDQALDLMEIRGFSGIDPDFKLVPQAVLLLASATDLEFNRRALVALGRDQ